MSPGKQIAAMAMNHPEEPDIVASKSLDILDKGAKVGPFFPADDEAEERASGPAANGQSRQAPSDGAARGGQAGTQPVGNPGGSPLAGANGNQVTGSQPGSMFTMPAKRNSGQGSPQDVFLHPTSNQPTYTKMSGNDFGGKPSSAKTDDEAADAWVREMPGWGMPQAGKAKTAAKAKPKAQAQPKAAAADSFWNMPGWED
ncbi:hypothetical protein GCM10027161_46140 [Microbispora hainanensis]